MVKRDLPHAKQSSAINMEGNRGQGRKGVLSIVTSGKDRREKESGRQRGALERNGGLGDKR